MHINRRVELITTFLYNELNEVLHGGGGVIKIHFFVMRARTVQWPGVAAAAAKTRGRQISHRHRHPRGTIGVFGTYFLTTPVVSASKNYYT
jgi:hypothetical protein